MTNRKTTYLYFDDQEVTAQGVKDNLDSENLIIEIKREQPWSKIIDNLLNSESTFDGLILDWRLDGEDGSLADFSAEALAQQCRMLQVGTTNGRMFGKNFPIILCSAQTGFSAVREKDTTSIDLFDGIFEKSQLEDQEEFLLSLVEAYKILDSSGVSISTILGLSEKDQQNIDANLIMKIEELKARQPHEMIHFILKELLNAKGALINEKVLAARLGVNIESEGWLLLKEKIEKMKYRGILAMENNWWSDILNDWWIDEFDGRILKFLSATERIELLEKKFTDLKGKLQEALLSKGADNKEFWTVCCGTDAPLAEVDGFIIDKHLHYSWQDQEYVCLEEAMEETHRGVKWNSLLSYEEERLKQYFDDIKE
jgi:hypothetical protein